MVWYTFPNCGAEKWLKCITIINVPILFVSVLIPYTTWPSLSGYCGFRDSLIHQLTTTSQLMTNLIHFVYLENENFLHCTLLCVLLNALVLSTCLVKCLHVCDVTHSFLGYTRKKIKINTVLSACLCLFCLCPLSLSIWMFVTLSVFLSGCTDAASNRLTHSALTVVITYDAG